MIVFNISFKCDKREGLGEDSTPLILSDTEKGLYAIGVFDGLGGSGSTMCDSDEGKHTMAYIASRIVKESSENFLHNSSLEEITAERLKQDLQSRLTQEKDHYPTRKSILKNKMHRDYPTTLAVVTATHKEAGYEITSYWAGDSRNYLWTKDGFCQISLDDLQGKLDPQQNLSCDAEMLNCVCADRDFSINSRSFNLQEPFVILSATDGCFGYLPTIMHFHYIILEGLRTSNNLEEWKQYIIGKLKVKTGDDMSLALMAFGFDNFQGLKNYYSATTVRGLEEILKLEETIEGTKGKLQKEEEVLAKSIQEGWHLYKPIYMSRIDDTKPSDIKNVSEKKSKTTDTNRTETPNVCGNDGNEENEVTKKPSKSEALKGQIEKQGKEDKDSNEEVKEKGDKGGSTIGSFLKKIL